MLETVSSPPIQPAYQPVPRLEKKAYTVLIIPAGGKGTRVWPLTDAAYGLPKLFQPIAGKSMLEHILDQYAFEEGFPFDEVRIVTGNLNHYAVERLSAFLHQPSHPALYRTLVQQPPEGNASAVQQALKAAPLPEETRVVIHFADTLVKTNGVWRVPAAFFSRDDAVLVGVKRVPDVRAYGVLREDDRGQRYVKEKPDRFESGDALIGIYSFPLKHLREAFNHVPPPSWREYGLDQLLTYLGRTCACLQPVRVEEWYDTGTVKGMLHTAEALTGRRSIIQTDHVWESMLEASIIGFNAHVEGVHARQTIIGPGVTILPTDSTRPVRLNRVVILPGIEWYPERDVENSIIAERNGRIITYPLRSLNPVRNDLRPTYRKYHLLP